ncbi:MAG: hypothetical protein IT538_11980 [Variibacter sp.]|nr:hypothetical protein [Variibacter sp.]
MARKMTDDDRPNITPELVMEASRDLGGHRRDLESAQGAYRARVKHWKKAGINTAALIEAMRIKREDDPDAAVLYYRDLNRYAAWINAAPGTQLGLFLDDSAPQPSDAAGQQQAAWDAEDTGYRAGQAGRDLADCPYPAGSELAQQWSVGHAKGKAVLADFAAGNPAEPVTRRGRKVRGTNAIVAGAAA